MSDIVPATDASVQVAFDWDKVVAETKQLIEQDNEYKQQLFELMMSRHELAARIGLNLIELKKQNPGRFEQVKEELDISRTTAKEYMHIATTYGDDVRRVAHLPRRVVSLISEPSMPADIREQVESGEISPDPKVIREEKQDFLQEQEAHRITQRQLFEAEQKIATLEESRPEPEIREVIPPDVVEKLEELEELEEELKQEKGKTKKSAEERRQSNYKISHLSDEIKRIKEENVKVSDALRKQEGLTREQIYKIQRQETWKQRADVFCLDANQFVHDVPYPDWAAEFFGPDELIRVNRVMKAIESIRAKLDQLINPQGGIVDAEAPAQDTEEASVLLVS